MVEAILSLIALILIAPLMQAAIDKTHPDIVVPKIKRWLQERKRMVAYVGFFRTTEVFVKPIDLGCGAGKVACFECGGDGDWSKFHPDPEVSTKEMCPCVQCKGTGCIYISI